jgi:hypothetical protein
MTDQPFRYIDYSGETLHITPVPDASSYDGTIPVVSLQIEPLNGDDEDEPATVYVQLGDVEGVIAAIRDAAADLRHTRREDCLVPGCGPCSFDRAVPKAAR